MPTKWRCRFWDRARTMRVFACKARLNALIRSLWRLELSDLDKSWHEGGHGRYQLNGVVGFGITCAQRKYLHAKRVKMRLFAVYGG